MRGNVLSPNAKEKARDMSRQKACQNVCQTMSDCLADGLSNDMSEKMPECLLGRRTSDTYSAQCKEDLPAKEANFQTPPPKKELYAALHDCMLHIDIILLKENLFSRNPPRGN